MKKAILFTFIFAAVIFTGCNQQEAAEPKVVETTPVPAVIVEAEPEVEVEPSDEPLDGIKGRVDVYYYNLTKDKEIDESVPCSADAILPVERIIPFSLNYMTDTINVLLEGDITSEEAAQGFQTEFPNPGFKLVDLQFDEDSGVVTLEFADESGFTSGGSCRVGLLANQIIKTAGQFPDVKKVVIKPEWLFQP